jgi:hypothetical protein
LTTFKANPETKMTGTGKNDINIYYPYHPSPGGNGFFMVFFFLLGLIITYQALSKKKYYILVLAFFALSDGGGYLARFLFALEQTPLFPKFLSQTIILVLVPNFLQAFMYAVTAELINWPISISPSTLLKKYGKKLPSIFILIDFLCLCMQGIAGGMLGNPDATPQQIENGKTTIFIGLALQLASLILFTLVVIAFLAHLSFDEALELYWYNFVLCIGIVLVIIRNIYRVVEYTEGNGKSGSLNETEDAFLLLEAFPMALTCFLFTVQSMAYLPERQYEAVKSLSPFAHDEENQSSDQKQVVYNPVGRGSSKTVETFMESLEIEQSQL